MKSSPKKLASRLARYERRKLAGLCVDCEAGLDEDADSVRCVECKERQLESQTRYLKTDKGKTAFNTRLSTKRAAWRQAGLCTRCGGDRDRDGVLCETCCHKLKCIRHGVSTIAQPARMPTVRAKPNSEHYQPLDERKQNFRVRILRALWWLSVGGDWSDTREIFQAANVTDDYWSRKRNGAQVALGRLVKLGLVEARAGSLNEWRDYRITDAGRTEVAAYRRGEFPPLRGRRAA